MQRVIEPRDKFPLIPSLFAICSVLFVLCLLISQIPLKAAQGITSLPLSLVNLLTFWHDMRPHYSVDPQWSKHMLEFLALVWLAFILYLVAAYLLTRLSHESADRHIRLFIWLITLVLGLVFIFMPSMLSHDIFVYAGYGRIQAIYHDNPYTATLSQFPHDVFVDFDDWRKVPSAYGPFWQVVSSLLALIAGDQMGYTVLIYRFLGLAAHLLNLFLITHITRSIGNTPRTITLGMLLYAWNPLVLEESCLGGHNDIFMLLFILLGLFLDARLTSRQSRHTFLASLPALTALTLAALVKFTASPILALYLILLTRRTVTSVLPLQNIKRVALTIIPAGLFCGIIAFAAYLPYWIGMTPAQITNSFTSPPSSRSSYGSILSSLGSWQVASDDWHYGLLTIFSSHSTWSVINFAALACQLVLGTLWLWNRPGLRTLILASMLTMGTLLLVTFWFFPWYLIWIVGLVPLLLPTGHQRIPRALLAFTLTFSASALCVYIYMVSYSSTGGWNEFSSFTTLGPPLLALLLFLALPIRKARTMKGFDEAPHDGKSAR